MKDWLVEYKAAAYRTRWFGITGAVIMLAVVGCELIRLFVNLSAAEVPLSGDTADYVIGLASLYGLIGASFVVRAVFLLVFKPARHSWIAMSWLMSFIAAGFYLWQTIPLYFPAKICREDGPCFTIYHHSSADWVGLACVGFVLISPFRALVTAAMAGSRYRLK